MNTSQIDDNRRLMVNNKLNLYVGNDIIEGIRRNLKLQRVFPFQTAKGVHVGDGSLYRKLYYKVYQMTNGDVSAVEIFFMYYGMYVDSGSGRGVPGTRIFGAPSKRKARYATAGASAPYWLNKDKQPLVGINRWQRPAIGPEVRYQAIRLGYWLAANYEKDAIALLTYAFGAEPNGRELPDGLVEVPEMAVTL